MKLLCEFQVANLLGHPFFCGDDVSDTAKKKRVRQLARKANVSPVIKKQDIWLFHEEDVDLLLQCRSSLSKDKVHPTGKSRARIAESAFEKARRLTTAP